MNSANSDKMDTLRQAISGRVVLPGDSDYEEAREIWNAMIDKRPAAIVQCQGADDVARALAFAHDNDMEISIRGAMRTS